MRLYLSVSGIGRGHAVRSYRLFKKIIQQGVEVYVSTYGDGLETFNLLMNEWERKFLIKLKGYQYVWSSMGLDWGKTISYSITKMRDLFSHILLEISNIRLINPDLVISDSRLSTVAASNFLNIPYILIANQLSIVSKYPSITSLLKISFDKFWGDPERIFITDLPHPYTISYLNTVPVAWNKKNVEYTGLLIDYDGIEDSLIPIEDRDIDLLIIVSAPKGDRQRYFLNIVNQLRNLKNTSHNVVVIGYNVNPRKIGNIEIKGWVDDTFEYLRRSKIVLLRGGQTAILESILAGTPIIVTPAPYQTEQEVNAISVERLGIGTILPYNKLICDDNYLRKILPSILENVYDMSSNIIAMRSIMKRLKGVNKVIEYLVG